MDNTPLPQPTTTRTALLCIDMQAGLTPCPYFGTALSTPSMPANVTRLLSTVRGYNASLAPVETQLAVTGTASSMPYAMPVLHVFHNSTSERSPLHPRHGATTHAFKPYAAPVEGERTFGKSTNSAVTSLASPLAKALRELEVRTVVVCGISTEHCVSTTTRMLADLDVVGSRSGQGRIVVVADATATFNKMRGGEEVIDAETVQRVHLASLEGEFATDVMTTDEVLGQLFPPGGGEST